MSSTYYIASCVFTSQFPELSFRIRDYVRGRWGFQTVRCCVPKYKLQEFTDRMPEGKFRNAWSDMQDSSRFENGDRVYSLCHNCNNIIGEMHPGVSVHSLWELIDRDDSFSFPDYSGSTVTVQDCWRAKDRIEEQNAVRNLLGKMNIQYIEAPEHHDSTEFCGMSLYRPQPPRNPKLAPKHYVEQASGKFISHTQEEQIRFMRDHCRQFSTEMVICYCHYCLEGLLAGSVDAKHIAQLLFP